jgi:HEPN domain-containing protein
MKEELKNWLEQAEEDIEVAEYKSIGMGEEESKLVKALKGF